MFNLSEQWKQAYAQYLDEQYDNFDKDFSRLLHS